MNLRLKLSNSVELATSRDFRRREKREKCEPSGALLDSNSDCTMNQPGCLFGIYQGKVGRLVVGQEDGQVEEERVAGGIDFLGDFEPVPQVLQHGVSAHVGGVEPAED